MIGRRGRRGLRLLQRSFWRAMIAMLLALIVAGLPTVLFEVFGDDREIPCSIDCDGSNGEKQCPPNCAYGACAKVVHAVPSSPSSGAPILAPCEVTATLPVVTAHIAARDYVNDVYHPPRG